MQAEQLLSFGPYQLDPGGRQLWKGTQVVKLTPKALAVLCYLVDRAGQLVRKEDLFQSVWADTVVSDAALTVCVQELRRVLRDDATQSRYIETVHRRGFRFIGKVVSSQYSVASSPSSRLIPNPQSPNPNFVGRTAELTQLHGWLAKALSGERQIVFVTGEPGIGKTTLVEAFLQSLESNVQGQEESQKAKACPEPSRRGKNQKAKVSEAQSSALSPQSLSSPTPNPQHPTPLLGRGQCIEHYGAGEAYLPLLSALGQLGREARHERLVEVLQQYAPTWLVQLPALLDSSAYEALQRKTHGTTRDRMLRELAEALEVLTTEHSLMLVLEDLHWSDPSTLEFLAFIARRRQPARVFIIGTYRPVEMLTDRHPLKGVTHELFAHDLGKELSLCRLSETEVATYLRLRFPESVLPSRLGQVLYQRTGGTPLFLASLMQDLISQGMMHQGEDGRWALQGEVAELEMWTPKSVRHVLARQRERLAPEEQQVLAAASLAGLEFSAAAVAAALEVKAIQVEEHCGRLAEQQQFLRPAGIGEWPDGTRAARYGFLHALYQEFWHERVSVGQQQQWHLRMGERKEVAYGTRAYEIAVELALHFAEGRDYRRAVQYLRQAATNATQRSAHQEAVDLLSRGLELLKTLPNTPERIQQELGLRAALGQPLIATKGYAAPEVERTYTRALELCEQVGETLQLFPVLFGLWVLYLTRLDMQTARERAEQLLRLARSAHEPAFLLEAHRAVGSTLYFQGELASARTHLEQALILYNPQQHHSHAFRYGQDPRVVCRTYASRTLWYLGYPDQALQRSSEAITLAHESSNPFDLAHALVFAAELHTLRREVQVVQERAEATIALCTAQEFPMWLAYGTMLRGLALTEQGQSPEGIAQTCQGLSAFLAMGKEIVRPDLLVLLAEAYGKAEQTEDGLSVLAEALPTVERTGMYLCEAELYRLKGELTLQQENQKSKSKSQKSKIETSPQPLTPSAQEAEACFHKAIEVAQKQQAKSLELRATMSLARLWQQQGKTAEAHRMLSAIYNWFTEGFDTTDLQEAKTLLEELVSEKS